MPTPSHGLSCSSRTFPTACHYCGDGIFVFQCSCGSVVLFDELGGNWPQHRLACYLKPGDAQLPTSEQRSDWIRREFEQVRKRLKPSDVQFVSIEPASVAGQTVAAVMVIREMPSRTQRIERMEQWNPFARAAMDIDQPDGSYVQITLADSGAEPRSTYPAIVERNLVDGLPLKHNSPVGASLQARSSGGLAEWFVTEIVAVGETFGQRRR